MDRVINADSLGIPKTEKLRSILFVDRDLNSDEIRLFQHGILEEDYGSSSMFFDNPGGIDTIPLKNFTTRRSTTIFKEDFGLDGRSYGLTPLQKIEKLGGLAEADKILLNEVISDAAIHKRVSNQEIQLLLSRELENRGIDIDYEYGVYSSGFPTKIKSKKFKFANTAVYDTPIFRDTEGNTGFALLLSFPTKKKFLVGSIMTMAVLSLIFVLVIIIAYSSAIYQLIQQKQISEIKSDFIKRKCLGILE
jgi:two-component system phosphate regulon sensor histidine kinase PhoR